MGINVLLEAGESKTGAKQDAIVDDVRNIQFRLCILNAFGLQ